MHFTPTAACQMLTLILRGRGYHTRGEHDNHYATDAVNINQSSILIICAIKKIIVTFPWIFEYRNSVILEWGKMGANSIVACDDMIASSGFEPRSGQTKDS